MQIDQDTYKDGKLYYGGITSERRVNFWNWRWMSILNLFETKYPEIIINLIHPSIIDSYKIMDNIKRLSFKYKHKIYWALDYNEMEKVNNVEFKILLNKFKNYLIHTKEIEKIKRLHLLNG
jgi:hypothetical protein